MRRLKNKLRQELVPEEEIEKIIQEEIKKMLGQREKAIIERTQEELR